MTVVQEQLSGMQDLNYREFQCNLLPTVERAAVIGVRVPELRKYAKQFTAERKQLFLRRLPHEYYDEDMLHALFISDMRVYRDCVDALDWFLPFVNNWAVCDQINPKVLASLPATTLGHAYRWISSEHEFEIRFGVLVLMRYYLGDKFKVEYADRVAAIRSDKYYVRMAVAWYFATALTKNWDAALPYVYWKLDPWTRRMAIQKAVESTRIKPDRKEYLKTLRASAKEGNDV